MKYINNFLRFKSITNEVWGYQYKRYTLLMKIHKMLTEDNNLQWKKLFGETILPNDTISRVPRYTTMIQKICDQNEWHNNYTAGNLDVWQIKHRPHLFTIG